MRQVERTLPVLLTTEEVAERGRQAARQREAIAARKADKKIADTQWKEETEAQELELDRLLTCVKNGAEPRSVACVERLSESGATVELVRIDTGEIVESRVATDADRQVELFPVPDEVKAAVERMRPKKGSGVDSVSITSGGHGVKLNADGTNETV